jgi:dimethylargininase
VSTTLAIVRRPSPLVAQGEVTHIDRRPMDVDRAMAQHTDYLRLLASLGPSLVFAPDAPEHPDGVFVEDALVMVGRLAVITRPGAPSRRDEIHSIESVVAGLGLDVARIDAPGTLDGGDVLQVGNHIFVGRTTRTSADAIEQLARIVAPLGRSVVAVDVPGCLHLKSAITALPDGSLIAVPGWVDNSVFRQLGYSVHDAAEPSGGDVLCIGNTVVLPASARRTAERIAALGFDVAAVDVGELEKVECGVTCMSVLVPPAG